MFLIALKLFLLSLIPIGAAIGLRVLDRTTKFRNLNKKLKMLIIGIVFGIISIIGTVFGVASEEGAVINIRDVGPVIAGLVFGGEAGILAGVIGGVYRFVCVYWGGAGAYTQLACSISTIAAGLITAFVRKVVFGNHHGKWYYGFVLGALVEDFHMLMVFLTHMNDIKGAYNVVSTCIAPMVLVTSISVMLASIGVAIVSKEPLLSKERPRTMSFFTQTTLAASLVCAYLIVSAFTYGSLHSIANNSTVTTLKTAIKDVKADVDDAIDRKMKPLAEKIAEDIDSAIAASKDLQIELEKLLEEESISDISIIDNNKKIVYCTTPSFKDYDMTSSEQSDAFNCLLDEEEFYVQPYQAIGYDSNVKMKFAGYALQSEEYGYIQIGYDTDSYYALLDEEVSHATLNRHVGDDGMISIYNESGQKISYSENATLGTVDLSQFKVNEEAVTTIDKDGEPVKYYYYAEVHEGYHIIAYSSQFECDFNTNVAIYATTLTEIFVFVTAYFIILILIRHLITNRINKINNSLLQITNGNLDVKITERKCYEFASLSKGINDTVESLKALTEKERQKMEKDLSLAKDIQHSVLPSTFPPFPNRNEFDLYAFMCTAKEVGGDFYDFYLVDDNHIAIQIADVSGKGVPAALFMMQAKSIIKGLAETGLDVDKVFTEANEKLCDGNDAQMFVTAWLGIIDITTGVVTYANAGHNPPLVKHSNGKFEYLKSRAGFVLAGMEGVRYKKQEFMLEPGDIIYIYTDGVTEATNLNEELYGEERLLEICNESANCDPKKICESVMADVNEFVCEAEQFDDITMLCFKYYGKRNIKIITCDATIENIGVVTQELDSFLEQNDCPMKINTQVDVALDEILSNIANYGYAKDNPGKYKVTSMIENDVLTITFEDYGVPFNPLEKADPDVTLSAEDRQIGGLGVFIVKKTMDETIYDYINGRNVLTIKKKLK